jgi:hypothetical protein
VNIEYQSQENMCFTDRSLAGHDAVGTDPAPKLHRIEYHEDPALAPFGLSRSIEKHGAGHEKVGANSDPKQFSMEPTAKQHPSKPAPEVAIDRSPASQDKIDPNDAAKMRALDIAIDKSMDALALIQKPTGGSKVYETQRNAARRGKYVSDIHDWRKAALLTSSFSPDRRSLSRWRWRPAKSTITWSSRSN